ncbi:MAG: hypothetical protein A2Z29_08965 [Chloroflexi bacterium RBG_16_56_11]|nr:MAG: hypothetical protein A2Z29_08965 [Chloroflexi bacterium RBG_16_56_11]
MKNILALLCVGILLGLAVAGCGEPSPTPAPAPAPAPSPAPATSPQTPKSGGTFRYINPRGPANTIGWLAEPGPPLGLYACTMMEGLVDVDYKGTVKPKLATAWTIAPDLTSITFTLRLGVKFHDGTDFNAAVAKWNYDQFLAAKLANVKDVSSVDVIDNNTIKINLKKYSNTLLSTLTSTYMVSKAAFDKVGKDGLRWNPVGTGPFKFVSFERDVVLKVARFPDYWQKGKPYLDAIEAHFIIDPLTASAAFEAGEADAIGGDVAKVLYDLGQKGNQVLKSYTGAITLIPDSKNPDSVWSNLKVRQAVDYAIDRDAIVKARGFGLWTTTYEFAPPDASAYIKDLPARTYNPEKAKQLLAEAGYPNGFTTKIIGDSSTTDKEATVAVQGFLSKVGIEAQLDWVDFAGFVQYVMGGWKDAILACANGFSAANLNQGIDFVWSQTAAFFPSVLKTDQLQTLLNESMGAKDYDPALVQKVLRYMHDEVMFLPLYCITRGHAVKPYVHDTGFYTQQSWAVFTPADTWLSK